MCGTFIGSFERRARKRHWCEACSIPIPAGFTYIVSAEVDGRDFISSKWHVECRRQFDETLQEYGDDCASPSLTWEDGMPPEVRWKYVAGPLQAHGFG